MSAFAPLHVAPRDSVTARPQAAGFAQRTLCRSARLVSLAALAVACVANASVAHAAQPTVVIASAPLVNPTDALAHYGSPASQAAPAARDALVEEAARSLRYDVDRIYEHVRDHVEVVPQFGLLKGARGVVLDGAGTPFDQAQFMVDALRESDAKANKGYNPAYALGKITLTAAQFEAWTGIGDAAAATRLLANGGIPATVTGSGTSFTVTMTHVWVRATIGGGTYLFDPSYKPHTRTTGLGWQSASGYSRTALLGAGGTGNATSVSGFNAAAFRSTLDGYRGNVEATIAANARGKRADAVVGASRIVAHPATEKRRTSLPHVTATDLTWTGQIPDAFRTSFTVSLNGTSYGTYFADVVAGQASKFNYVYANGAFAAAPIADGGKPPAAIAASILDACDSYLGNAGAASAVAQVAINHPYAADGGGYSDRTLSRQIQNKQCASGAFFVTNDWGYTGTGAASRLAPVASSIRSDPTREGQFTFAPTLGNIASQYSAFLNLASRVQGNVYQLHDLVGIHTLDNVSHRLNNPGPSKFDPATLLSMNFEASISAFSKAGTTAGDTTAAYSAGFGLAYAEGAVPRQETDAVHDMAALNLLTQQDSRATTPGQYATYLATPSTWSSVRASLSGYPNGATAALDTYANGEGYSLLVPQQGALRQPTIQVVSTETRSTQLWEGFNIAGDGGELKRAAFLAFRPSNGVGSAPDRIALAIYDQRRGSVIKAGVGVALDSTTGGIRKPEAPKAESRDIVRSALQIDGKTGALSYAPAPDLVDGTGAFPKSLSLQRAYDQRDPTNYGFGIGWKHNWYQAATLSNDGMAALGRSGAPAVASALVALQALGDLVTTQDARHLYAAAHVASWLTDQTINNTVSVARGLDSDQSFYRQASGAYAGGAADGSTLTVTGAPTTGIMNRRVYLDHLLRYTDREGTARTYKTSGSAAGRDMSFPSNASLFTRKTLYLSDWQFPNGTRIDAAYGTTIAAPDVTGLLEVYNTFGRRIARSFYDYGSATGQPYCDRTGGPVLEGPARDAEAKYRNSTMAEVRYAMTAQVEWQVTGNPDDPRCPPGSTTPPMRQIQRASFITSLTDAGGALWRYGGGTVANMFGATAALGAIYKPTSSVPAIMIGYGGDGNVRSVTDARLNTWSYYNTPSRSEVVSPTQAASGSAGTATYYDSNGQPVRQVGPLGRATANAYDDLGRPTSAVRAEGDATLTEYDVRGNPLRSIRRAKPNTGLADIVTTTGYVEGPTVASCVNPVTCNRPSHTIDGRGYRTGYSWDAITGEALSVTSGLDSVGTACLVAGGTCPTTTYGYTGFAGIDGRDGTANGTITLPTSKTETIKSGVTRMTTYDYDTGNKLSPKEQVVDKNGLALRSCFKFDAAGNLISATEPKAGLATCS